jgi:uncharacterized Zn-finger protein
LLVHKTLFIARVFYLEVQKVGLKRITSGNWFNRFVLISWIMCGVFIYFLFKDMELIVHGQLYYYGLNFSSDWADPYRLYTWLIYLCLGLPMALSGIALVSSFLKDDKVPEKIHIVPQKASSPQTAVKIGSQRELAKSDESINRSGLSCPHCKKAFSKPLVMLDFQCGKTQLISVCPYCNHVLETNPAKSTNQDFHVRTSDEEIMHREL